MKATKYIAAIALLLGLVACQPNDLFNGGSKADAEMVEVTFSVQFPEPIPVATKASMGETPTLTDFQDKIYLCLFGSGDGAFQNWIKATDVTLRTEDGKTTGKFKALLPLTDDGRTVHIFVDPPAGYTPGASDYIDLVMENMVKADGEGAYWQEIKLPHGIYASPTDGTKAHQDIIDAFTGVQLLRNFAKIVVDGPNEGEDAFELKSWALINVPTKGYIAPYTRKFGDRPRFPEGYSNAFLSTTWTASSLLTQLVETDDYLGFMPPVAEGENIINTAFPAEGAFLANGAKAYMYERPVPDPEKPTEKQTAVLIEIEFLPDHGLYDHDHPDAAHNTFWYKVEVLNDEGDYVPILRNFVYKMHILGLEETGESSAQAAYDGAYYGNISASLETASLNDLSNGKSAIHVDQLDFTFIGESGEQLLKKSGTTDAAVFYFTPNVEYPDVTYWQSSTENHVTITVTKEKVPGYQHSVASFRVAEGGAIYVTLEATGSTMKKSIIRVKGIVEGGKELYRDITITLMDTPTFEHGDDVTEIIGNPDISGIGKPVKLQICLPEGLGSSLFPIQVRIEASNNTLSATSSDLAVRTGTSVFDPTRNTFYYIYTIKYSDYCWLNSRTKTYEYRYVFGNPDASGYSTDPYIIFYTNKPSGNDTQIRISDMAGKFEPTTLTLPVPTTPEP